MSNKPVTVMQHEPVRVPQGWNEQDKSMITQLNRLLDEVFKQFRGASGSHDGMMTKEDKEKLDGIEEGATNVTVADSLTDQSTTKALSAKQGYNLANGSARDSTKIAVDQGSGNAGKFLVVGNDGKVAPVTVPSANGVSF